MFDNIGKKIKTLTKVVCWIGMIACFIVGIVITASVHDGEAIGVPIMLGGPLLFWLGSFLMYGFGELVDKTASIEEMMRKGAYGAGSATAGFSASAASGRGSSLPAAAGIPATAASGREASFPAPATPAPSAPAAVKSVPVPSAPASVKHTPSPVITVSSDGNFKYSSNGDGTVCVAMYVGKATALRIPEKVSEKSVIAVNSFSFASCINITEVIIPQSVTSIGERAFRNCSSLCNVVIPGSVTAIGESAFADCPNLILTVIPGSYAEQYCKDNGLTYRLAD